MCVATISGTAGYEAFVAGKPAIMFGHNWYRSLPGVNLWSKDLNLDDVLNSVVPLRKGKPRLRELLQTTAPGINPENLGKITLNGKRLPTVWLG